MHQSSFKISNERRPLALWIFHGFIYCALVYLDKQGRTLTTFVAEVLNVPMWAAETTGYKLVCLPEGGTCTLHHRPAHLPSTQPPCHSPGCVSSSCSTMKERKAAGMKGVINVLAHGISTSFIPSDPEWSQRFRIQIPCSLAWTAELR